MREGNSVTVVTGGGSGIGRAVVEEVASSGGRVMAVDIDEATLSAIDWVGDVLAITGDVAAESTWSRVIQAAEKEFGEKPTRFVSNAAIVEVGTTLTLGEEQWQRTLEVNLMGAVRGARALIPGMIVAGGGSIVTVASVDAFMAEQGLAAYCASKGALLQYTRVLALDHARDGIRANCVAPGVTDTPLFRYHVGHAPNPEALLEERLNRQPIGRFLEPTDVARTVAFLLSDASAGITGAMVPVDGGLSTGFDFRP